MIASVGIELVPALDDRVDHVLEYLEAFLVTSSETHAQMRLEHTALQQYHITSSSIAPFEDTAADTHWSRALEA